jgi:hypothetical protein
MSLNKKLLASTIIAGLAISANAQAAVILGTDDPLAYASQLDDGTTLSDTEDDATFAIGYNFSNGEVRNGRFECTSNMTLDNVTLTPSGTTALGSINGEGTSALFFSMTGDGSPSATETISVDSDNTLEDGGDVQCAFSIYDQPSQAQAGGDTGRIYSTGWQPFITRASGFVFVFESGDPSEAVADVEAPAGAYFGFTPVNDWANFANFRFQEVTGVLKADGSQVTIPDMFSVDTDIVVDGDFSAADNVWLWDDLSASWYWDIFTDDRASFRGVNIPLDAYLQYDVNDVDPIQESTYTATLLADANPGYTIADVGPIHVGDIVRNGTELQAPLAQVPGAGWLSRMVLTNTGSVDRPYAISVMGETGNTIGTDNTTGVVPADGTIVVDLTTVMSSFTAGQQRRGTLNVTVAAPNDQIQGLYQIVNTTSGSLSNHVMVRPGSN